MKREELLEFDKWVDNHCSGIEKTIMRIWNERNNEEHPKFKRLYAKYIKEHKKLKR